jgi:hypothetical protein
LLIKLIKNMQKLKITIGSLLCLLIIGLGLFGAPTASAAVCTGSQTPATANCDPAKRAVDCPSGVVDPKDASKCVPLGTNCNTTTKTCVKCDINTTQTCLQKNPIVTDLNIVVGFLSALVGIVVIGMIMVGGIQYTLAGDNATATGDAKKRIVNGLIALAAFIFTFAFLQWLIPGGL